MQTALTYRTNRDLFSNYYLDEHLPETEEWDEITDEELQQAYDDIKDLWDREKSTAPKRNESQLEEKFIRPMFRKLGIPFEVEESTSRTQRRPDYGFFETEDAARDAFERREEGDFYKNATAVADAKRWGRPLDTRGSGEHKRDFENPSYQIHVYLQEVDAAHWAVLTNGQKWRLYYGPTSHRLDSYYEVDLPTILEDGDLNDFKYFYLFFRNEAFIEDAGGESFLDDVYDESNVFAQELGEDLQDNIYEAIKVLSEGYLQYSGNNLGEEDLGLIHDSSLIYLYRLIFVLYAEAEGRQLLDTDNEIYEEQYSLNALKQEVANELDSADPKYRDWQNNVSDRLDELFSLIDQGSRSRGIPEEDLYIPAYNGGLFRTNPDEDDSPEARFLANHTVGDSHLARVVELLTRSQNDGGKIFVDYSSLDVRHLGSIYEGLLEYKLDVADEPLTLDNGQYVSADKGDEIAVQDGEVYLTTGSGERKATGSYYTPEYVVEYIINETLGPLVDDIREDLVGQTTYKKGNEKAGTFADQFAERVFDLKILDPAMGSGHFLTGAVDYLAREVIDAQERQAEQQGVETVDEDHDINWARRQVAQQCIYGVDLNPLAVELAKVSLWLRTLAAEQPLAFLDHHLKTGNSLVGSDIEEIEELESDASGDGKNTTLADFGVARKGTIEQLMRIYGDFIAIENRELADVKQMEAKYDEFERNKLRQRLEAMTNVYTADEFGLDDIPNDVYKRLATALEDDDEWKKIEKMNWYQDAQAWAAQDDYFHWKLEFPEVFYDSSGEKLVESGFDAVIGNPPWVSFGLRDVGKISDLEKQYIKSNFRTAEYKISTYPLFMEKAISLCHLGGLQSFIVPDSFLLGMYFQNTREFLLNNTSLRNINLIMEDFWEDAEIGSSVIYTLSANESENELEIGISETLKQFEEDQVETDTIPQSYFEMQYRQQFRIIVDPTQRSIIEKIESQDNVIEDIGKFYSGCIGKYGQNSIKSNEKRNHYTIKNRSGETVVKDNNASDHWEKLLPSGSNIAPYAIFWDETYVYVNPKQEVRKKYAKSGFDLEMYEGPKLFVRQTGDSLVAAVDSNQYFCLNNMHVLQVDEEFSEYQLGAILNSNLLEFYYETISLEKGRTMAQTDIDDLENLPVPQTESPSLDESCQVLIDLNKKFATETRQFLKWISRFWQVELDNLTLKTHLREYWDYDFEEMLRIAKKNKSNIEKNIQSRDFQEKLESEWKLSMEKLDELQEDIDKKEIEVSAEVFHIYNLNKEEVSTVLETLDVGSSRKTAIIEEFER